MIRKKLEEKSEEDYRRQQAQNIPQELLILRKKRETREVREEKPLTMYVYPDFKELYSQFGNISLAWDYYIRAKTYFIVKRDYSKAIFDLTKAIYLHEQNSVYYLERSGCFELIGKLDDALVDIRRAIVVNGKDDGKKIEMELTESRLKKLLEI